MLTYSGYVSQPRRYREQTITFYPSIFLGILACSHFDRLRPRSRTCTIIVDFPSRASPAPFATTIALRLVGSPTGVTGRVDTPARGLSRPTSQPMQALMQLNLSCSSFQPFFVVASIPSSLEPLVAAAFLLMEAMNTAVTSQLEERAPFSRLIVPSTRPLPWGLILQS